VCETRARKVAAFFDKRLGESEFVAGDRFTIADITLHVTLGFGRLVKFKPWEEHANLNAWRERMTARPGWEVAGSGASRFSRTSPTRRSGARAQTG